MNLYRKHRPKSFDEIIGNEVVIESIQSILKRRKLMTHSFLFKGPSGCGKTTLARILAKEIGCHENDFVEMDSADFRGIDTIRQIRYRMNLQPLSGDVRIWLLDEVHQLSKDAMNALLKALEDTPKHVYFILATTEPEKLLRTIKNRCTEFEVESLSSSEIYKLVKRVVKKEKQKIPVRVMKRIAKDCLGSPRSALVILDSIIGLEESKMLKIVKRKAKEENQAIDLCRALVNENDWNEVSGILIDLEKEDPERVRQLILAYMNTVLLNSRNNKQAKKASTIIQQFKDPFFTTGKAGLSSSCFIALSKTAHN